MNYSAEDLQNISFKTQFRGYDVESVDAALDKIISDYKQMLLEQQELRVQVRSQVEETSEYKQIERSLKNALLVAQQTADEMKMNAQIKADNVVQAAELERQRIIRASDAQVADNALKNEQIKREFTNFKKRLETLLLSEFEVLKKNFIDDYSERQEIKIPLLRAETTKGIADKAAEYPDLTARSKPAVVAADSQQYGAKDVFGAEKGAAAETREAPGVEITVEATEDATTPLEGKHLAREATENLGGLWSVPPSSGS